MVKVQLGESIRILKELLEKVPAIENIQITDRSEQEFTVIFRERRNCTKAILRVIEYE